MCISRFAHECKWSKEEEHVVGRDKKSEQEEFEKSQLDDLMAGRWWEVSQGGGWRERQGDGSGDNTCALNELGFFFLFALFASAT